MNKHRYPALEEANSQLPLSLTLKKTGLLLLKYLMACPENNFESLKNKKVLVKLTYFIRTHHKCLQ